MLSYIIIICKRKINLIILNFLERLRFIFCRKTQTHFSYYSVDLHIIFCQLFYFFKIIYFLFFWLFLIILGITHYSFQCSTWASKNYCYLEDLFVDANTRGQGIGRVLIDAVYDIAKKAGSSRLYWNTNATNETARKLYDSYSLESGKVQYRLSINNSE